MKLSKETLDILKNFSGINNNIVIPEGNVIRIITPQSSTIMGEAKVVEHFPKEFGIFNLSEFLGVLSLFESPDLEFNAKNITIKENDFQVKYEYCSPTLIKAPPKTEINFTYTQSLFITKDEFTRISKAAAILAAPDMVIEGDGKDAVITVKEKKNQSSNQFSLRLPVMWKEGDNETYHVKFENIRFIPGAYTIKLSPKAVKFENVGLQHLHYYVALVPASVQE